MSVSNGGNSVNATITRAGPAVIQAQDFFVKAGILHPIIVGSIAVIALFAYIRLASNRVIAPITVFDWIINVALGSTVAGIVNGNSLVRGLLSLVTMLSFQWFTSHFASNYKQRFGWIFQGPPLVIAFRGEMLRDVMRRHRISTSDVQSALRMQGVLNIRLVECIIIEANGSFSVFTMNDLHDLDMEPEALLAVPAYCKLMEKQGEVDCSDVGKEV